MICPNCRQQSYCGCSSCLPKRKADEVLEIWLDKEIGVIACGHCGFAMIGDAWQAMEVDMYLEPTITLAEAAAIYRPKGKMPNEQGYKPSFKAHWNVKLWRWRSIFKHTIQLLIGHGIVYEKTRLATIKAQLSKL